MQKQRQVNIAETNIALFGSDLEHKIKQESAKHEDAWKGAGQTPGVKVWRVNHFHLEAVPEKCYGEFYDGDSYVVLKTVKDSAGKFSWDIYFWLGTNTTADEAGTAAYKAVELDTLLGGAPVQHREVEGHESESFLEIWTHYGGLRILKGGYESGFHHVGPEQYEPRLLQVKGTKKSVRVRQVPIATSSLNSNDVFILDEGLTLYQFNGKTSSAVERAKAAQLIKGIHDQREGRAKIIVCDEGDQDCPAFWAYFGGPQQIKPADDTTDTVAATQNIKVLYCLDEKNGQLTFTKVAEGKVGKSMLNSKDVFIFDAGPEVFVWIGKNSTKAERKTALQYAADYLKQHNRPQTLPITRVYEEGETEVFFTYFDY